MHPIDMYACRVVVRKIPVGKYQCLACVRHEEDRKREKTKAYPYRFNAERASLAIEFFLELKHYEGEWAGQPFILESWQQFIVGSVFGWVQKTTGCRGSF